MVLIFKFDYYISGMNIDTYNNTKSNPNTKVVHNQSIIAQVLFKKYNKQYSWLTFLDLNKILEKYFPMNKLQYGISMYMVRNINILTSQILEKINVLKKQKEKKKEKEDNSITNIKNSKVSEKQKPKSVPVLSYKTYNVLVDSKDRNIKNWKNHNPFQFTLGPSTIDFFNSNRNESNAVFRNFSNVHAISIKTVILPRVDEINNFPYLLLSINELGSNVNGTNEYMNKSYGYLSQPNQQNDYLYYNFEESFETIIESGITSTMTKIFSPRIDVSRLTFSITNPDGEIITFDDEFKSISILLQITCLRKELDNNSIIRPN